MINLAANLSFLYQNVPFLDRFKLAANDGFRYVEYLFPYDCRAQDIKAALTENQLTQALFNLPPGNWENGDRGLASLPHRQNEFTESVLLALEFAKVLDCKKLHVMSGIRQYESARQAQLECYINNLRNACQLASKADVTLLIEPINSKDMPHYFLDSFDLARNVINEVNEPNLKLQFDIYHCQRIMGDILVHLEDYLPLIGHIQIANPPHRTEPSLGELNYKPIFEFLDKNYGGVIGCEYKPSTDQGTHLDWARPYLKKNQG
ncbi:2-oxo-tetronate isomerase [Sneathiella glossodoripedis]|uniref:2-oxo-tetronate isomerase n=1 Tax=Sneathiella glossodoripedis TaxID=418853 RepID=UPI0004710E05|nr:2-oxo-tetronate isomerase [Sneathiella glossodoripedis]